MFFESSDGLFGGIDMMVMWRDQLGRHLIGADVILNRFGAFVVHDVQCRLVAPSMQNSKDFGEGSNEGGVSVQGHWADNDGVEVIDVGNEDVNHVLERPDRESTGEVHVHGTGCGICEGCKTKLILGCTSFMVREQTINFGMGKNNASMLVAC